MMIITGATGKIGSQISKLLNSQNINFTAISRTKEKLIDLNLSNMEIIEGDIDSADIWMNEPTINADDILFLVRVNDSFKILEDAKKKGINKIIFLSSASINHKDSEHSENAQDHKLFEDKIKEMGFNYVFIRPEAFMSNALYWSGLFKYSKDELNWPRLSAKYASVHENDVAEVVVEVSKSFDKFQGKVLTLTGANVITQKYMLSEIIKQTKSQLILKEQSLADFEIYMSKFMDQKYISLREADWEYSFNNKLEITDTISTILDREPLTYREWVSDNKDQFQL
ncbi:SDR family oxidoreductase [Lactococcus lactis]|uniref:SDR family oxidoreductase n=1 Tax=Lactococcus lactis TaxID=1358 RepID=UPI00223A952B|nr:NAD(P)H-binding protein [Lactococcus lactis]MCT1172377.1 NAD-dependent epimerase/dehydratase family protein [Lactococcus lactis]